MAFDWTDLIGPALGLFGQTKASSAASDSADAMLEAANIAAESSKFKPYGVTTGFGTSWFNPYTQQAGYQLDPALAAMRDQNMLGAAMVTDQLAKTRLDPTIASQQYYNEMQNLMQPQRAQDRAALQQDLFGSGRLGMRLAGEGAGAGAGGGMYQPDVLGYNKAQELANQQMAMQSRQQALNEMDAAIARGQGLFSYGMGVEQYGMTPMEMGSSLGGQTMQGGSAAASNLMSGATNAANARLAAGLGWSNTLGQMGTKLIGYNKPTQ